MLSAMFCGRMDVPLDPEGTTRHCCSPVWSVHRVGEFVGLHAVPITSDLWGCGVCTADDHAGFINIDRDGTSFRYILNYLRDGTVVLPSRREDCEELLAEARYFALDGLVSQILRANARVDVIPSCRIAVIRGPEEMEDLVASSRHGKPLVVFMYNRSNNKISYTGPSDGG